MVAPIDAVAKLQAGGETITLRLNFRSLGRAHAESIDLFDPQSLGRLTTFTTATLVYCLAIQDQPDFTEEQALALVIGHGESVTLAIFEAIKIASGKGGESPRPPKASRAKPTA